MSTKVNEPLLKTPPPCPAAVFSLIVLSAGVDSSGGICTAFWGSGSALIKRKPLKSIGLSGFSDAPESVLPACSNRVSGVVLLSILRRFYFPFPALFLWLQDLLVPGPAQENIADGTR